MELNDCKFRYISCLHVQIDCFTCVEIIVLLYKYFAPKHKFPCHTELLPLSLSSSVIVATNGEVTEVMDSEKEKSITNCARGECAKYPILMGSTRYLAKSLRLIIATIRNLALHACLLINCHSIKTNRPKEKL